MVQRKYGNKCLISKEGIEMKTLISDEELIKKINEFDKNGDHDVYCIYSSIQIDKNIRFLHVTIWDSELDQVDIVVSAIKNKDGISVLGNHKAYVVSSFNLENDTVSAIKEEGKRIKSVLQKKFNNKGIKITSNLHYNK